MERHERNLEAETAEEEHETHDANEAGDGGVPAGEHLVNTDAAQVFAALVRANNGLIAYLIDEVEAHMRDSSGTVEAALGLHLPDDMLERFLLVLVKVELFQDQRITLSELCRRKTDRETCAHSVILDQVHDGVQAAVHRAAVVVCIAVVHFDRLFLILRDMERVFDQLVDALILRR